jgi:hypothetical protein
MRIRLLPLLVVAILTAGFAATNSLDDLVRAVRDGNQQQQTDEQMAHSLHRLNLNVKLDNRTAEELESLVPGPKSIAELERQRDITQEMPAPAATPSFPTPPDPGMDELHEVLAAARGKALAYTVGLPDFICTETVRRYEAGLGKGTWAIRDTLTLQLTYFEHEENYKLTAMNGHKTGLTYDQVGGASSKGEFGSMLLSIFSPDSRTTFAFSNWTTLRKRPSYVFAYRIELRNSNYHLTVGTYGGGFVSTVSGEHGLIYIDRETRDVMRLDCQSDSIPDDFPLKASNRTLDYGLVDVGGRSFLLPTHAEVFMIPRLSSLRTRNEVEFTDYRKFTGQSTISFGDPSDEKSAPAPPTKKK